MSKTCLISDLHLEYLSAEEKTYLIEFLRNLPQGVTQLVLNGDAFDAPSDGRRKAFPENVDVIIAIQELLSDGIEFTYVAGNHDIAISALTMNFDKPNFEVVYPSLTLEARSGEYIWIEHGHAYDPFYKAHLYSMAQIFEEVSGIDPGEIAVEMLAKITSVLQKPQKKPSFGVPSGVLKIWENAAARKLEKGEVRAVIMGHTHAPGIWKIKDGFYINIGSWIANTNYVIFDEEKIQLHEFKGKQLMKEVSF